MNVTTREWIDQLMAQIFPSQRSYQTALQNMELGEEQDINLDVKLREVQNAIQQLEKQTDKLAREADRLKKKYERELERTREEDGAARLTQKREADKLRRQFEQKYSLLKQLVARHQILTDVELKLIKLGQQKQIQQETPSVDLEVDGLESLRDRLEEEKIRTQDRLAEITELEDGQQLEADFTEVEEDIGEREMVELEEGFGNIEEDLFDNDEEEEFELS